MKLNRRSFLAGLPLALLAQEPPRPYDESKLPHYTLPDPLLHVKTRADWDRRRVELIHLFEENVYGNSPGPMKDITVDTPKVATVLGGKATRKMVTIHLGPKTIELLMYLPKQRPAPVFVGVNFRGNQTVTYDPDVPVTTKWVYTNMPKDSRGMQASNWPVEQIIDGGFGIATFYSGDISPDFEGGFPLGIEPLFYRPGQTKRDADEWGSIGAWAWGLSRVMDYFETDPDIDRRRVAVMGHSRMGKTALWASARDPRFAIAISNCSGAGGATLARRRFGETVKDLTTHYPFWFCENYAKYAGNEDAMPVDQHELLALSAPRPLYVAVAQEDLGSDPHGQFLSALAASPVYKFLGTDGLALTEMPPVSQPVMSRIGFHMRPARHDITPYDWEQYIKFAAKYMKG